ncbi:MAG: DUF4340 domain-containing protein [Planctomycetota bacterium]
MNEEKKTGAFWGIAAVMLAVGLFFARPASNTEDSEIGPGTPLFEEFKDPLAATSLKVVSFDEDQGQLDTFEVRRDSESGQWTIPSRSGYPADAVEQMKDAANSLVGLQILDVQTRSAEFHDELGVVEPKLDDLEVGDEGVGRLVSFRDASQKTLAGLIIGKPVKDEEGKIYVRKPGQDPVYVVKLDDSVLTTRFQDWIEDDLLQLSSIDIEEMEIKDYSTSMNLRGSVDLVRNYTAEVSLDGSTWQLDQLLEFDRDNPLAEPTLVEVDADRELNTDKINDIKNALDDLKIVNVVRKPDGMSASLKADKSLLEDTEASTSLATRGFLPVQIGPGGSAEILSANGELTATTNEGVQYVLRFGNVSGLTSDEDKAAAEEEEDESTDSSTSVNRYLLVTARVNEAQFPPPELQPVPQSIQELEAMLGAEEEDSEEMTEVVADEPDTEEADTTEMAEPADASEATDPELKAEEASEGQAEEVTEEPASEEPKAEAGEPEGEATVSDAGSATGEGQGFADDEDAEDASDEETPEDSNATSADDGEESEDESSDEEDSEDFASLTDEEKQERLEAEQEKVLKENQRLLDERKDRLAEAKRRVRELNERFADWYYVIPETTYSELRVGREDLLKATEPVTDESTGSDSPIQLPNFNPGQ